MPNTSITMTHTSAVTKISRKVRRKVLEMSKNSRSASRKPLVLRLTYDRLRGILRSTEERCENSATIVRNSYGVPKVIYFFLTTLYEDGEVAV